jgi:hypothetical protein
VAHIQPMPLIDLRRRTAKTNARAEKFPHFGLVWLKFGLKRLTRHGLNRVTRK